jgi:hypothetical protein
VYQGRSLRAAALSLFFPGSGTPIAIYTSCANQDSIIGYGIRFALSKLLAMLCWSPASSIPSSPSVLLLA